MFWIYVLSLWSGQSEFMALFMVFNLWIGPGVILSFHSSIAIFPVSILGLDLFSCAHLDMLLLLWCQVNENSPI